MRTLKEVSLFYQNILDFIQRNTQIIDLFGFFKNYFVFVPATFTLSLLSLSLTSLFFSPHFSYLILSFSLYLITHLSLFLLLLSFSLLSLSSHWHYSLLTPLFLIILFSLFFSLSLTTVPLISFFLICEPSFLPLFHRCSSHPLSLPSFILTAVSLFLVTLSSLFLSSLSLSFSLIPFILTTVSLFLVTLSSLFLSPSRHYPSHPPVTVPLVSFFLITLAIFLAILASLFLSPFPLSLFSVVNLPFISFFSSLSPLCSLVTLSS